MDYDITRTVSPALGRGFLWRAQATATTPAAEQARRRDPRRYHYMPVLCPYAKAGAFACPKGDHCEMAHQVYELWLHPLKFRSELCRKGPLCDRKLCFFAHRPDELRSFTKEQLIATGEMAPPPSHQHGGGAATGGLVPPGLMADPTGSALAAAAAAAAAASAMGPGSGLATPSAAAAAAAAAALGMAGGDAAAFGAQHFMAMANAGGAGAAASLYMGALAQAQLAEGGWSSEMAAALGAAAQPGGGAGFGQVPGGGFGAGAGGGFGDGGASLGLSGSHLWSGPPHGFNNAAAASGLALFGAQQHQAASHGHGPNNSALLSQHMLHPSGPAPPSPPRRFGSAPLPAQPPPPPPPQRAMGAAPPAGAGLPQRAADLGLSALFEVSGPQRGPISAGAGGAINGVGPPAGFAAMLTSAASAGDALPPPSPPPALASAGARHSAPLPFSPRPGSAPPTPPSTSLSAPLHAPQDAGAGEAAQHAAGGASEAQRIDLASALGAAMAAAPGGGAAQLEALAAQLRQLSLMAGAAGAAAAPQGGEGAAGVVQALAAALRAELDAIALMGPNGGGAAAAAARAVELPRGEAAAVGGPVSAQAGGAAPGSY
ncbi:zinc finger CCCH domain-containing protein [Raphidocelis subcapitata]|uniref:Zinc finger CCCH domain-containing protein n=1 Tax=Raphidocelis subcapitata TaxID=307507 RepID=A0A2V0NJ82_9CHLO|nr:zinc finger CCCH domain-containing protein [Raphidocelis subcapitata]|eukprot:GBF87298.1 zinc finger CCCH domain-containing protein [Raphidocelis subcapitata]